MYCENKSLHYCEVHRLSVSLNMDIGGKKFFPENLLIWTKIKKSRRNVFGKWIFQQSGKTCRFVVIRTFMEVEQSKRSFPENKFCFTVKRMEKKYKTSVYNCKHTCSFIANEIFFIYVRKWSESENVGVSWTFKQILLRVGFVVGNQTV